MPLSTDKFEATLNQEKPGFRTRAEISASEQID